MPKDTHTSNILLLLWTKHTGSQLVNFVGLRGVRSVVHKAIVLTHDILGGHSLGGHQSKFSYKMVPPSELLPSNNREDLHGQNRLCESQRL